MKDYEIIGWPEIQNFSDLDDFNEHATLIEPNDSMGIGSSTYLVEKEWIESLKDKKKSKESNLLKFLKSDPGLLDQVIDDITEWMQCKDCPAKKFCDTFPKNEKLCSDIFKEWSLKEE